MPSRAPILVIDNDRATLKRVDDALGRDGYAVHAARTAEEGWRLFGRVKPRAVLVDPHVPRSSDLELLRQLRQHADDAEILFLLTPDDPGTVTPQRADAKLVLDKPLDPSSVRSAVERVVGRGTNGGRDARAPLSEPGTLISDSPAFRDAIQLARSVADTDASVLIHGESGTGKELVADYIYRHSPRADRPFVKINCAALPKELIEAELFGYRKGAFTGAGQDREGVLETADGGSLLLDEIGEMPPNLQTKLLRVLQEREFRPVGSTRTVAADFRLISTTNVDLQEALRSGALRDDLYYRVSAITLRMPALRERAEDLLMLARHFMRKHRRHHGRAVDGFTSDAEHAIASYSWPGNVRELENAIERAVIMAGEGAIDAAHLPESVVAPPDRTATPLEAPPVPANLTLAELERTAIQQALERHRFNKQATAKALGLHRATLYSKMRKHGLGHVAHRGSTSQSPAR